MHDEKRQDRVDPQNLPTPKKVGEPGRTPGTAEGGERDEPRHNRKEPGRTPGTAEGGVIEPSRH